jgi:predicted transcriptional regulator
MEQLQETEPLFKGILNLNSLDPQELRNYHENVCNTCDDFVSLLYHEDIDKWPIVYIPEKKKNIIPPIEKIAPEIESSIKNEVKQEAPYNNKITSSRERRQSTKVKLEKVREGLLDILKEDVISQGEAMAKLGLSYGDLKELSNGLIKEDKIKLERNGKKILYMLKDYKLENSLQLADEAHGPSESPKVRPSTMKKIDYYKNNLLDILSDGELSQNKALTKLGVNNNLFQKVVEVMKGDNMIESRKDGNRILYSIGKEAIRKIEAPSTKTDIKDEVTNLNVKNEIDNSTILEQNKPESYVPLPPKPERVFLSPERLLSLEELTANKTLPNNKRIAEGYRLYRNAWNMSVESRKRDLNEHIANVFDPTKNIYHEYSELWKLTNGIINRRNF